MGISRLTKQQTHELWKNFSTYMDSTSPVYLNLVSIKTLIAVQKADYTTAIRLIFWLLIIVILDSLLCAAVNVFVAVDI